MKLPKTARKAMQWAAHKIKNKENLDTLRGRQTAILKWLESRGHKVKY